jgi:hypothetical protein
MLAVTLLANYWLRQHFKIRAALDKSVRFTKMYAPIFDPKNLQTESTQLRIDFTTGRGDDPINLDGNLHYTRPRQHVDVLPRPNMLTGFLSSVFPMVDIWSQNSTVRTPFGLNPTNPAVSGMDVPYFDWSVNGLKKVG